MLKIRLQRHGAKHAPFYRMVVTEVTAPRDGRFIEILGTYDPQCHAREDELKLKMERIDHWLGVGAQPTDTVRSLIRQGRLDPEAWLARAEKKSQSKAARRLKGATTAPSMDDSTGDTPAEDSSPPADAVAESPVEEPAAAEEEVVSEPSSEATAPDGDAENETAESEDSPVDEEPTTDEEPVAEDSSADSSEEEVAEESVSEDESEAESADAPAEDDAAADSPKEASAEDETAAEEESDGGGEEEKSKD